MSSVFCFLLSENMLTTTPGEGWYVPAAQDKINKIQDSYGINVFDYCEYNLNATHHECLLNFLDTAACDCSMNGSGTTDVDNLPADGE